MSKPSTIRSWLLMAGSLFISTYLPAQLPDYHLQSYGYSYGIRPGAILSTLRDKQGFLWILYPRLVQRFDGKQVKNFAVAGTLHSLFCDASGQIWVIAQNRVLRFVDDFRQFRQVPVADSNINTIALFESSGRSLTLFCDQGLYTYDPQKHTFIKALEQLPLQPPYSTNVFAIWDQTLFFKRDSSIYSYTLPSKQLFRVHDRNIRSIFPLNKDSALVSTWSNGRYWYNFARHTVTPLQWQPSLTPEKKTGLYVRSMAATAPHTFLVTTREGIFEYNSMSREFKKLQLFQNAMPVVTSDFANGISVDDEKNVWLTTIDGIARFSLTNPSFGLHEAPENQQPVRVLHVLIERVTINDNDTLFSLLPPNPLLKPAEHSFEIEFAAPYFDYPYNITYRYKLEGYDKSWKYMAGNTLRFAALPAGNYYFRLQASLNSADWTEAENNFRFRIQAPFWQRWWFVTIGAGVAAFLIYLVLRRRTQKLHAKQEELETEKAINYFASSLHEHQTIEAILWDVAKNCISRLNFEDCVIYLVDKSRNALVQKAAHGPKSAASYEIHQPIEIPIGQGITGAVAKSGKAEIISDTTTDSRYIVDDKKRCSEIAVPIISDGNVLGVIDSEHSRKNFFTQKHLSILTTIASLCANKIVRARAEEEKQKAQQILMSTQQKMTEVEMQALRAQMNPHFIFNCLNSINRYIVKSDQVTASLYLTRFAKLIRLILDNSNSKHVMLSNELEALKLYIDMEALRFDKKFSYDIRVDKNVMPDTVEVPPLIIQPYVENAIWHGLLHKETIGHLHIQISLPSENLLECTIEDNGVGREKAKEMKSKSAITKKSLGMTLTENRLALLNKYAELNARIEIIDLYTESREAAGTKVILTIPV